MVRDGLERSQLSAFLSSCTVWNVDADKLQGQWRSTGAGDTEVDLFRCRVPDGDTTWTVDIEWHLVGRRFAPKSVAISCESEPSRPVTSGVVGRMPIGLIQREARRTLQAYAASVRPRLRSGSLPKWDVALAEEVSALAAATTGPKRGSPLTDADLEAVGRVYKEAADGGYSVTAAVADVFHVSKSTAGKRIMRARAAGLLDGYENGPNR